MPNTSYKHNIPVPRSHPDYEMYYREVAKEVSERRSREWAEKNKEKKQAQWRAWYERNKAKQKEKAMFEKAEKLQRMPPWTDKQAIAEIYANRPEGHHVDHIVPLRGKNVSGLHVPWNLQYLPAKENMSKGNRYSCTKTTVC